MKSILWVVVGALVISLFFPFGTLLIYKILYNSIPICPSDFLNYFSNAFTGLVGMILSFFALYTSTQKEKVSIQTSKSVIRNLVELSCLGFKENHKGKKFRYYRPKLSDVVTHLQILKNASILTEAEMELCRKINDYVRSINDTPSKSGKDKISKIYNEFWDKNGKLNKEIKKVLKRL